MKHSNLDKIKDLVDECVKNQRLDFIANLIYVLQQNYQEIAKLATDGSYHEGWSHQQVIDFVTYEA